MTSVVRQIIDLWIANGMPGVLLDLSLTSLFEIPSLPPNVQRLDISSNNIRTIRASDLPDSLIELTCNYNDLEVIEKLPPNIRILDCMWNHMKTLPDIPASLEFLHCSHNRLQAIPEPPIDSRLRVLTCGHNRIVYLPKMETIYCLSAEFNSIQAFPTCGPNTYFVGLGYNCIEVVPDTLPRGLTEIVLTRNNIRTIDHVRFPPGLITLSIGENPILNLPANLPNRMDTLNCGQMRLSTLPDTLPTGLVSLSFAYNDITEIPDTLLERCPKLHIMWCNGTKLIRENPSNGSAREFVRELIQQQRLQSKQRIVERTKVYKEEMMQVVWHPNRIVRMWFSKGLDFEDLVFCYE